MTTESHALRAIPLALTLATYVTIIYIVCLALALIVPDRGLHAPWLQFFVGFSWTWQGIAIGLVESVIYGFLAGVLFAPIYNFFNDR